MHVAMLNTVFCIGRGGLAIDILACMCASPDLLHQIESTPLVLYGLEYSACV